MKPTEEMIKSATDHQLAELSAVYLKEWHICYKHWFNKENELMCAECEWNPVQNIGQAMELLEEMEKQDYDWRLESVYQNYFCAIIDPRQYDLIITEAATTKERAITKAALMAIMEE